MQDKTRRWIVASAAVVTAGIAVPAGAVQFHQHALQGNSVNPANSTGSGQTASSNMALLAASGTTLAQKEENLSQQEKALNVQIQQLQTNLQSAKQQDSQLTSQHSSLQNQVVGLIKQAETLQVEQQAQAQAASQPSVQTVSRASGDGEHHDGDGHEGGDDD